MRKRIFAEKLLLFAALFCFLYYLLTGIFAGFAIVQLWMWLVFAAFFLLWYLYLNFSRRRKIPKLPKWALIVFAVILISALCLFLALEGFIISSALHEAPSDLDYVIVLGAAVHGDVPSLALQTRINAAVNYTAENSDIKIICSGGQGSGENISEAEAMRLAFMKSGIAEEQLIIEDKSASTAENLRYSLKLPEGENLKIGIVSNNFHIFRALLIAAAESENEFYGISAPYPNALCLHYFVREAAVTVIDYFRGNIG